MQFREFVWMEMLRGMLKPVPQPPKWHAEGDVFTHTRLVRQSLNKAVSLIAQAASNPHSAFSNLNMDLNQEAIDILRLAAWLHDLGKESATTVGPLHADTPPQNWKDVPDIDPESHELHAKHHEKSFNFNPGFRKLMQSKLWQKVMEAQNYEARKDLAFVIRNHMQLRDNLGSKILSRMVDQEGKYKNTRRVKLLLVFFLMDRIGRRDGGGGESEAVESIGVLQRAADKYVLRFKRQSEPAPDDPREFAKQVPQHILPQALKGKFGREFSPEEISNLLK